MAKEADKEVKAAQEYIRKLSIVSTKGPQANAPTEFIEEKADPQVLFWNVYFHTFGIVLYSLWNLKQQLIPVLGALNILIRFVYKYYFSSYIFKIF